MEKIQTKKVVENNSLDKDIPMLSIQEKIKIRASKMLMNALSTMG
jgi:hypothetical protein